MKSLNQKYGFYAAVLFMIWPLLALASAFKNYKASWGKNILWAFVAFYGYCFAIGAESQGSDIVRYVAEVKYLHNLEMNSSDAIQYFLQSGEIDILRTLIVVVLSRITDSQAILTLIYGIVFGFFFSRNMWYVLKNLEGKIQPITKILLICFFLVIPIWDINGFRMWTAAHIFLYGALPYLFEGKKNGLFILMSAIFVHYAMIVPVGALFGYLLLGNRLVFYFSFFVLTIFISEINLDAFNKLVENYAPEIVQERTASYRAESFVEDFRAGKVEKEEERVWYVIWYERVFNWAMMGFLTILFFQKTELFDKHKGWLNLFSFTLLFYGASNLLSSLPSGARFISIANLCALFLIILYIQNQKQELAVKRFVYSVSPALVLYIVVAFRTGLYSMSATTLLGNPFIAFFLTGEHVSLNDMMKMIL